MNPFSVPVSEPVRPRWKTVIFGLFFATTLTVASIIGIAIASIGIHLMMRLAFW